MAVKIPLFRDNFPCLYQLQYEILLTYDYAVDFIIRESDVRPVYGRQGSKVSEVEYYISSTQGFD